MELSFIFEDGHILSMAHKKEPGLKGVIMKILRWKLTYDHTARVVKMGQELYVTESVFPLGVIITGLNDWLRDKNDKLTKLVVTKYITPSPKMAIRSRVKVEVENHTPYDISGVAFWQLWYRLIKELVPGLKYMGPKKKAQASKAFWCSEYVGYVEGSPGFWMWDPSTPLDPSRFQIIKHFEL